MIEQDILKAQGASAPAQAQTTKKRMWDVYHNNNNVQQAKRARWESEEPQQIDDPSLSPLSEASIVTPVQSDVVPFPSLSRESSYNVAGSQYDFLETEDEVLGKEEMINKVSEYLEMSMKQTKEQVQVLKQPHAADALAMFFSAERQKFGINLYVKRIVDLVNGSSSIFIVALCLLDRLQRSDPILRLHEYNVHRLWMTSIVLASKALEDEVYSNLHYAKMGGIPSLNEMNKLESCMLNKLNFRLSIPRDEYMRMRECVLGK